MPAIYHEGSWLGNATDPEVLVKDTVGWTGKNLLRSDLNYIKKINTSGTWNGDTYTNAGCSFTLNADGSIAIVVNTSPPNGAQFKLTDVEYHLFSEGDYILSGERTGGSGAYLFYDHRKNSSDPQRGSAIVDDTDITVDYANDEYFRLFVWVNPNIAVGTTYVIKPMLRKADITDPTYEPYHESVEEEIEQIYAGNGVLGAKNLLPYPYAYSSRTENGITWTDNKDGSITINGTSTAITIFRLIYGTGANLQWLANKIVSVSDISGPVGCQIALEQSPWTIIAPTISESRKESLIPSVPNNSSPYTIKLYVPANVTVNNLTVHPMLRLASDPDDTYQPYAMTNRELTEKKINISDLKTVVSASSDFADFKTRIASL